MASVLYAGDEPPHRGLSGIFRKKSKSQGGSHSLFDAEHEADALDAFHLPAGGSRAAAAAEPLARQGSKSGGSRWGILSRKNSMTQGGRGAAAAADAAAQVQAQAQLEELQFFKAECLRQGQEMQELQDQLALAQAAGRQAAERLNMQRFKYELLIDLWAMRVLDNEEMGALGGPAAMAAVEVAA